MTVCATPFGGRGHPNISSRLRRSRSWRRSRRRSRHIVGRRSSPWTSTWIASRSRTGIERSRGANAACHAHEMQAQRESNRKFQPSATEARCSSASAGSVSAKVAPIGSEPSCEELCWQELGSEDSSGVAAHSDSLAAGLAAGLAAATHWLVECVVVRRVVAEVARGVAGRGVAGRGVTARGVEGRGVEGRGVSRAKRGALRKDIAFW